MDNSRAERDALLDEIIEREPAMFLATPNEGGISACQQRPETFRVMRRMAHVTHDDATLLSCLGDLRRSQAEGRNPVLERHEWLADYLSSAPRTAH